jgi:hypothetical protein
MGQRSFCSLFLGIDKKQQEGFMSGALETYDDLDDISAEDILGLNNNPRSIKEGKKHNGLRPRGRFNASARAVLIDDEDKSVPTPYADVLDKVDQSSLGTGLTFRQRKAIRLISAYSFTDEMVAAELGVTVETVKRWRSSDDAFKRVLYATENHIHVSSMKKRVAVEGELVESIHDELLLRVHQGELRGLSLEKLVKLSATLAHEARLDDPDSVTSRTKEEVDHVFTLNQVKERFNLTRITASKKQERAQLAASNNTELQSWLNRKSTNTTVTIEAGLEPRTNTDDKR